MSSAVGEDTARTITTGRQAMADIFTSAQTNLKKIFAVFLIGFVGSFYALRIWIWDFLKATAEAEMSQHVADQTDVITRTPFEVILLQAKIGLFIGIIVAIPALLYYSRDALKRRGYRSVVPISRSYIAGFAVAAFVLFWAGIIYAFAVFFPFAFDFLATNADNAGVKPSFGITEFTEFMALLTLSFGLAAQLPLFMGILSYTEIVPYETFRDRWRHAFVGIVAFGALFSPPDPFTQIMWAIPLITLYIFSLGLAKVVTNIRRQGDAEAIGGGAELMKRRVLWFSGGIIAVWGLVSAFVWQGGFDLLDDEVYPLFPSGFQPSEPTTLGSIAAEYGIAGDIAVGLIAGLVVGFVVLLVYTISVLRQPVYPKDFARKEHDPAEIDLEELDAAGVEAAPAQVFLEMSEDEALDIARSALHDDNREKAQTIIDRFDALEDRREESNQKLTADTDGVSGDGTESAPGRDAGEGTPPDSAQDAEDESEGFFESTAAGMLDPFTEEETTEDDIGGYAYDIAFIFNSLTSKMFRIVGLFMVVMGGTFFWLYSGGLRDVLELFASRVPEELLVELAERNDAELTGTETTQDLINAGDFVIALHPVEVLIFEVKVSTLAAIVAVLPLILYYAWPAMKERGLARGDRRLFIVWGGSLLGGFALGATIGFLWVAPGIISYLIADAIAAEMIISYRIKSFFWLVIFTTVGIGFLLNIIVTMALFHVGGIVSYRTMLRRWRAFVIGTFTFTAFASPSGVLTMIVLAIPIAVTYLLGLVLLYALTLGGRLFGGGGASEVPPGPESDTGQVAE